MKIKDAPEPFNTLVGLIEKYSMATVLYHLSAIALTVSENLALENIGHKDLPKAKRKAEQLGIELGRLSDRATRSWSGEEDPTDKQGLN